jgi:porin
MPQARNVTAMCLAALAAAAVARASGAQAPAEPRDPDDAMRQRGLGEVAEPPDPAAPAAPATAEPPAEGPFAQQPGFTLFPSKAPTMAPYLSTVNLYGDQCLQKDPLLSGDPLSLMAQAVKTELAKVGITYAIWQSYDFVAMSGTLPGKDSVLNYYSFNSYLMWNLFQSDEFSGTSGWITVGASAGAGLGADATEQNAWTNLGVIGYPVGTEYGQQAFLYQLAWQQSFLDGSLVATVGFMDPEVYMDLNTYSNNQYNQLLNYEFINPSTVPWSFNALGVVLQWQPVDWFYAMFGSLANNTISGQSPFVGLSSDNWTNTFELGFIVEDAMGLGRAVYRVLPYWGSYQGEAGSGVMLNVEQQLGKDNPCGVFVRTAYTGGGLGMVQNGEASAALGLVFDGPSASPLLRTEQAYFAAGAYWLRPADPAAVNLDEYGVELTYVIQLTETLTLQPDLQFVFQPAYNADESVQTVFTMQLNYVW